MPSPSTTLFICEGDQSRLWDLKEPKQLANFTGRPLLARTIEQIDRCAKTQIIINAEMSRSWQDFARDRGLPLVTEPGKKPDQDFLDVLVHFREMFDKDGPTYILYGDVVWSERMIRELYKERDAGIWFATRFSPTMGTGTWRAEIFGFRVLPSFLPRLDEMLASRQMSPYHKAHDIWDLFHWLMDSRDGTQGEPGFLDAGDDDYTLDIDYPGDLRDLPMLEIFAGDEQC